MNKIWLINIWKILLLSLVLVWIFQWAQYLGYIQSPHFFSAKNKTSSDNQERFVQNNNSMLGKTSVAISTNIGIKYGLKSQIDSSIYKEIFSLSDLITSTQYNENKLLAQNYNTLREYKNILKTDFKELLNNSYNKKEVIDAILWQLQHRYLEWNNNSKILLQQRELLQSTMNQAWEKISTLKNKMDNDHKNLDISQGYENIKEYVALKDTYYNAKVFITYINAILKDYQIMNNYNKKLLDTLINNKDALIKNAYVVIPDSGTELLDDFNLLYTEEQYKSLK